MLPATSLHGILSRMKTISYVLYREDEFIVAQCLNVEVSSFGATRDEAVANLKEAVELYFEGESGDAYTPVSDVAIGQELVNA
jgi:predicted RNase H-like HicB family nuclease